MNAFAKLRIALSAALAATAGAFLTGCQMTGDTWFAATASHWEAQRLSHVSLDADGQPRAVAVRYGLRGGGIAARYLVIPLGEDGAPDSAYHLPDMDGRARHGGDDGRAGARVALTQLTRAVPALDADPALLARVARARPRLQGSPAAARGNVVRELNGSTLTPRRYGERREVMAFEFDPDDARPWWDRPTLGRVIVVPARLPRSTIDRARSIALAVPLTPVALAGDFLLDAVVIGGVPLYLAGVWEWP